MSSAHMVLVLNASYMPLGLISWTKAIILLWQGKAVPVVDTDKVVHSAREQFAVPSVIRRTSNSFYNRARIKLTRRSVFARDDHVCQYCGVRFPPSKLNLDHVIPASRGGRKSWTNIVTSCVEHNTLKANRTPEEAGMALIRRPQPPHWTVFDQIVQKYPNRIPSSWLDFLPQAKNLQVRARSSVG